MFYHMLWRDTAKQRARKPLDILHGIPWVIFHGRKVNGEMILKVTSTKLPVDASLGKNLHKNSVYRQGSCWGANCLVRRLTLWPKPTFGKISRYLFVKWWKTNIAIKVLVKKLCLSGHTSIDHFRNEEETGAKCVPQSFLESQKSLRKLTRPSLLLGF